MIVRKHHHTSKKDLAYAHNMICSQGRNQLKFSVGKMIVACCCTQTTKHVFENL